MSTFDYCYDGTETLINKYGIKDAQELKAMEDQISHLKIDDMYINPISGSLDYNHLKKMHKFIFSDLYNWAGEERKVNISKGFVFCDVGMMHEYSKNIFDSLKKKSYYQNLSQDSFIDAVAELYSDLNCLHPFREGNGRANKIFR